MIKRVLSIAGSDSGGGAGIQADLKTFCAFGVFGMTAITAVTAQNTQGVMAIENLKPEMVYQQIKAVCSDIGVDAAKTGMLSNTDIINEVARSLQEFSIPNLVVDPVMVSKSGNILLQPDAVSTLKEKIFPLAKVITPNLDEASILSGIRATSLREMRRAARILFEMGPKYVLLKGGHLTGKSLIDLLYDGKKGVEFPIERIGTKNTHGTGCTYSAALASLLALGYDMHPAVAIARKYMNLVITYSLSLGKGFGPTNHLAPIFLKCGLNPQDGGWNW